jgi:hypothetical protein
LDEAVARTPETRDRCVDFPMVLREPVTRWLRRPRPWKATIVVNRVIMPRFLWHMTAYLLAILALWPLGFGREHDSSARWWAERALWILVPGLIAVFGRFERPRPAGPRRLSRRTSRRAGTATT